MAFFLEIFDLLTILTPTLHLFTISQVEIYMSHCHFLDGPTISPLHCMKSTMSKMIVARCHGFVLTLNCYLRFNLVEILINLDVFSQISNLWSIVFTFSMSLDCCLMTKEHIINYSSSNDSLVSFNLICYSIFILDCYVDYYKILVNLLSGVWPTSSFHYFLWNLS